MHDGFAGECRLLSEAYFLRLRLAAPDGTPPRVDTAALPNTDVHVRPSDLSGPPRRRTHRPAQPCAPRPSAISSPGRADPGARPSEGSSSSRADAAAVGETSGGGATARTARQKLPVALKSAPNFPILCARPPSADPLRLTDRSPLS